MCLLNKNQVSIIEADVEMARITFMHLSDDLIDHICCEVEQEMNKGKSFDEAYEIVKQQTGIKVLQKIQDNTRYLIDKNYRTMRKTMKISGIISLSLMGIATVLKIMHLPGAGPGLVLGFFVLCVFFFPTAVYINYKDVKQKSKLFLHLSALIGGIAFMAGVLFKVMHWPGASALLITGWTVLLLFFLPFLLFMQLKSATSAKQKMIYIIGVVALIIFETATAFKVFHWPGASVLMIVGSVFLFSVFVPMFSYMKFKESGKITGQYIFIITTSMFFILFTFLLAINVSKNILDVFVIEDDNTAKITSYIESKNEKLYAYYQNMPDSIRNTADSNLTKIKTESAQLSEFINKIKIELISAVDKVDINTAKQCIKNTNNIMSKDNYIIVTDIMLGENYDGQGTVDGLAKSLKEKIEKFKLKILEVTYENKNIATILEKELNTNDGEIFGEKYSWEVVTFYHNFTIRTLAFLSKLESNIRMIESESVQLIIASK